MPKLAFNKGALNKQKKQLTTYQRFLPALELKQKQLMAEKKVAERRVHEVEIKIRENRRYVEQHLMMLGCSDIHLEGMVKLKRLELEDEHVVGIAVPAIKNIVLDVVEYGYLSKPHWVDSCINKLKLAIALELEFEVMTERLKRLEAATRSATQRVNLFSKILIPDTQKAIRKIGLFVSDMETASVARSKLTKQKANAKSEGSF